MSVYFIQAGEDGPIKVGVSEDVESRLQQLQAMNPTMLNLRAAIPGGHELEALIHRYLRHLKIRGEWFEPSAAFSELAELIYTTYLKELIRLYPDNAEYRETLISHHEVRIAETCEEIRHYERKAKVPIAEQMSLDFRWIDEEEEAA